VPVPCGAPGTPCADRMIRGGYIRIGNEYHPLDSPIARAHGHSYAAFLPPPYSSLPPTTYTTISAGSYSSVTEHTPLVQPLPASQYVSAPSQYVTTETSHYFTTEAPQYATVPSQSVTTEAPQSVPSVPETLAAAEGAAAEEPIAKKVIVVFGATGTQAGGLVDAILSDPAGPFTVRAVTRDPESAKSLELARRGAEVVGASLDVPSSVEQALEGAYGAYFVTFYFEHSNPEKEKEHAYTLATAAKNAGLKHVIWSTLEDTRRFMEVDDPRMPTLFGKYKVAHFDAKGESDEYFRDLGVPTTFLLTSFYYDNFTNHGMGPRRGEDGKLTLALPIGQSKLPGLWAGDIGRCAYAILKAGEPYLNTYVGVASELLTGDQMAAVFSKVLGEPVGYHAIPADTYRALGFPGAEDMGNMFQFQTDFEEEFCGARDPGVARRLHPAMLSLEEYLRRFPVVIQ
jgi:uncharacterized protein YbjT (DUF2867 family)